MNERPGHSGDRGLANQRKDERTSEDGGSLTSDEQALLADHPRLSVRVLASVDRLAHLAEHAERHIGQSHHNAPGEEPHLLRRLPKRAIAGGRARRRWLFQIAAAIAGATIGLIVVLNLGGAHGGCPPSGEGLVMCELQKMWGRAASIICGSMVAAVLLTRLIAFQLPSLYRRWRTGELRNRRPSPPAEDSMLTAASWGVTEDDRQAHGQAGRDGLDQG